MFKVFNSLIQSNFIIQWPTSYNLLLKIPDKIARTLPYLRREELVARANGTIQNVTSATIDYCCFFVHNSCSIKSIVCFSKNEFKIFVYCDSIFSMLWSLPFWKFQASFEQDKPVNISFQFLRKLIWKTLDA